MRTRDIAPSDDLHTALGELKASMKQAQRSILFEPAQRADIRAVFAELRRHSLEPSSHLMRFYETSAPIDAVIDPWIYADLEWVHLNDLVNTHQDFMWSEKKRARECWRGRWIVIARAADDPYFVDACKPELPVYTDTYGTGAWKPKMIAPSLAAFMRMISVWVDCFVGPEIEPNLDLYREHGSARARKRAENAWATFRAKTGFTSI